MESLQNVFERNLDSYRQIVADIEGFSVSEKDEAIRIIFFNMQAFVEQAWGINAVQLALRDKFKNASQKAFEHDNVTSLANAEPVDLSIEGAIIKSPKSNHTEDYTP